MLLILINITSEFFKYLHSINDFKSKVQIKINKKSILSKIDSACIIVEYLFIFCKVIYRAFMQLEFKNTSREINYFLRIIKKGWRPLTWSVHRAARDVFNARCQSVLPSRTCCPGPTACRPLFTSVLTNPPSPSLQRAAIALAKWNSIRTYVVRIQAT